MIPQQYWRLWDEHTNLEDPLDGWGQRVFFIQLTLLSSFLFPVDILLSAGFGIGGNVWKGFTHQFSKSSTYLDGYIRRKKCKSWVACLFHPRDERAKLYRSLHIWTERCKRAEFCPANFECQTSEDCLARQVSFKTPWQAIAVRFGKTSMDHAGCYCSALSLRVLSGLQE